MEPSEYLDSTIVNLEDPTRIDFRGPKHQGRISIIIPVKNDLEGISATLFSLKRSGVLDRDSFEVLVCSDGGNPKIGEICIAYNVQFLMGPGFGSYSTRNHGIRHSSGQYLAFIDADVEVTEDWVDSLLAVAKYSEHKYFGGPIHHKVTNERMTTTQKYLEVFEFPCEYFGNTVHFFPTGNMVVERDVVERCGGFDSRLRGSGDLEFGQRIFQQGFRGKYLPNLLVYHPFRTHDQLINKLGRQVIADWSLNRFYPQRYPSLGYKNRYLNAIKAVLAIRSVKELILRRNSKWNIWANAQIFLFAKYISFRRAVISLKLSPGPQH